MFSSTHHRQNQIKSSNLRLPTILGPFQALVSSLLSPEQFLQQLENNPTVDNSEAIKWVYQTLTYELKAVIRGRNQAKRQKDKLKEETLQAKIRLLKQTPDPCYQDTYNRLVCQKLDQLQQQDNPELDQQQNQLAFAQTIVDQELLSQISDQELIEFSTQKTIEQIERLLNNC